MTIGNTVRFSVRYRGLCVSLQPDVACQFPSREGLQEIQASNVAQDRHDSDAGDDDAGIERTSVVVRRVGE